MWSLHLSALAVVLVLSLVRVGGFLSSWGRVNFLSPGRRHARAQGLWQEGAFTTSSRFSILVGQEKDEQAFAFPPPGLNMSKLSNEEIVALARHYQDMQGRFLKERAEKQIERAEKQIEKERAEKEINTEREKGLRLKQLLSAERTNSLERTAGLHMRGLLETAERDIKKLVMAQTEKIGRGRRDWWMAFVRDTEEGESMVECLRGKDLLQNVEDDQVPSVVADTMVSIFKRINSLMHPPVRNLGAVSIVEGPLTVQECFYLECIADELKGVNYETFYKRKQTKQQDEGAM